MRCSQPYGLPLCADGFLHKNAVRINRCPHCKRDSGYQRKDIGEYGMFQELQLQRYTLLDGSTADEFIQHEVWSSGPMTWLGLRLTDGTEFKWLDDEMEY